MVYSLNLVINSSLAIISERYRSMFLVTMLIFQKCLKALNLTIYQFSTNQKLASTGTLLFMSCPIMLAISTTNQIDLIFLGLFAAFAYFIIRLYKFCYEEYEHETHPNIPKMIPKAIEVFA